MNRLVALAVVVVGISVVSVGLVIAVLQKPVAPNPPIAEQPKADVRAERLKSLQDELAKLEAQMAAFKQQEAALEAACERDVKAILDSYKPKQMPTDSDGILLYHDRERLEVSKLRHQASLREVECAKVLVNIASQSTPIALRIDQLRAAIAKN